MSRSAVRKAPQTSPDEPKKSEGSAKVVAKGRLRDVQLTLSLLREATGKTQVEVAEEAGMNQAEVSRVEHRKDVRLSTLRRFLGALDADLEIVAVFPKTGHRIRVDM